jgi:RNA polymerase sigma-70 factor (ECF subfamily)
MTVEPAQFGVRAETNDDFDLVQDSKNGDVAAFEQLVKRYDRKLFRIAQSVTHNREDSQDAVQEAFLKAYQHLGDFRGDSQFSTWLIRITLNQSLMKLRKQRRTREVSLDEDFGTDEDTLPREVIDWAPNAEELYSVSELRNILIKTIEELSPILRTVFVLQDIEGLSNGSDGRGSEPESIRCEVAALAGSVAASRTAEQILQQVSAICASRVTLL